MFAVADCDQAGGSLTFLNRVQVLSDTFNEIRVHIRLVNDQEEDWALLDKRSRNLSLFFGLR